MDAYLIFETEHFKTEQCRDCSIPGYLIVSAKAPVTSLGDLSPPASRNLGEVLQRAARAIEALREWCTA
jgi:diadenosine tetraphosphate (Ap4A) HIT family hydrolase